MKAFVSLTAVLLGLACSGCSAPLAAQTPARTQTPAGTPKPAATQTAAPTQTPAGTEVVYKVKPSTTDPQIHAFDYPNLVIVDSNGNKTAQLVVFLPGTGENPDTEATLLHFVARLGYRVIGLTYDNA